MYQWFTLLSSAVSLAWTRVIDGIFYQLHICFAPNTIADPWLPGHSDFGLRSTRCSGQQP